MFRGFEARRDADATQRYLVAAALAVIFLIALGGAAIALSSDPDDKPPEPDVIEVSFDEPQKQEAPPPPPPPPPVNKPLPAATKPAPRRDAPPPTPTKIERDPLPKGKVEDFTASTGDPGAGAGDMTAMDLGGAGGGFGGPAVPKAPPPPPPKPKPKTGGGGPIVLPEDATPPKPLGGNPPPEYPSDARAAGLEGEVFLKIVIKEDGTVGDIEVKRGEEPFVSAAVAVVKDWKYSPALVDGKPTAVYRVIKVPFRLKS